MRLAIARGISLCASGGCAARACSRAARLEASEKCNPWVCAIQMPGGEPLSLTRGRACPDMVCHGTHESLRQAGSGSEVLRLGRVDQGTDGRAVRAVRMHVHVDMWVWGVGRGGGSKARGEGKCRCGCARVSVCAVLCINASHAPASFGTHRVG